MHDIIKLLPDAVANQIAAGEVIQRPASAVKELLENAVDSGASDISLIIKDSGKTLIQVTDNGCGMTETDARIAFERHATSKIRKAEDLFAIKTMGFRGEALASIAAIAQVDIKTRQEENEIGSQIIIEGSKVLEQSPCQCQQGTTISVKNLFFNVPARRNFLKSNTTELRHIMEEFQRVAIAYPGIAMKYYNNDKIVFQLKLGKLKQRIMSIYGNIYNEKLLPVDQQTEHLSIMGYVGKPEQAKKTRGGQYFFVNKRYFRHPYFNHAVNQAFHELIPDNTYPSYFLFFEIEPDKIDVNIHPTKTEVNFSENQLIYAILRSAVKQAIGKFSLMPTIDFDSETRFDIPPLKKGEAIKHPSIRVNKDFNPFKQGAGQQDVKKVSVKGWKKLFEEQENIPKDLQKNILEVTLEEEKQEFLVQLQNRFLLMNVKSGLMIIDQHLAHQRILFERYVKIFELQRPSIQKTLFPETIMLSPQDTEIIKSLKNEMKVIGFEIEEMGKTSLVVNGIPTGMEEENIKDVLEKMLESYKQNEKDLNLTKNVNIAFSLAVSTAIKSGKKLMEDEIQSLINQLFSCKMPQTSPGGESTLKILTVSEIYTLLNT